MYQWDRVPTRDGSMHGTSQGKCVVIIIFDGAVTLWVRHYNYHYVDKE